MPSSIRTFATTSVEKPAAYSGNPNTAAPNRFSEKASVSRAG
jgi:hypothetical protein